jgi:hypothetical protein
MLENVYQHLGERCSEDVLGPKTDFLNSNLHMLESLQNVKGT